MTRARAERAPAAQKVPVPVEHLDVVPLLVADVDVAVSADRDRGRPGDLTVAASEARELPDVLLVDRADGDPQVIPRGLAQVRPIDRVQPAARGRSHVDRRVEAGSGLDKPADGMRVANLARDLNAHRFLRTPASRAGTRGWRRSAAAAPSPAGP